MKTTGSPDPALAGWALIWLLPGSWLDFVPQEIGDLRAMDMAFRRGDWGRVTGG